jgi:FMN phosphatase YigB (HAD superfamily)
LKLLPEEVLMVDDLDRNLLKANDLGMHTAYICYDDPMTELPDFIDAQFKTVLDVLKVLKK